MDSRNQTPFWSATGSETIVRDEGLRSYMLGIYNYMWLALALTGVMAYAGANVPFLHDLLFSSRSGGHMGLTGLGMIIAFSPLIMSFTIAAGIRRLSVSTAQMLFWTFAALMGLSLSSLFFIYTGQSLVRVFFVTSILFGTMGIYGYTTQRDLTSMNNFMVMGFIGIFIACIVNLFLHSEAIQFVVSALGVVIFTGFMAYDTQKLKSLYYATQGNAEAAAKTSILGALNLYIDFINLFVSLLRFMGDRR